MATLDEARQALAMATADAVTNARLVARAYPTLRELLSRLADDPDAVRYITEEECLAVRAAIIYAVNSTQLALLESAIRRAVAENN